MNRQGLVTLIILDGWGISPETRGNAVKKANIPNYRRFLKLFPNTTLKASGLAVGLPEGQMGNSEVGHLNIGAGRVMFQDFTRITKDIENGDFFKNPVLTKAMMKTIENKTSLHIMGLLSDGGVHSHNTHLYALLKMAKNFKVRNVYLHIFLDGRDVPPANAKIYIKELEQKMRQLEIGKIATVSGRYYAMDRDKRWDRTEKAYNAMVLGEGPTAENAEEAVEKSYNRRETDEFVVPTVILNKGKKPVAVVKEGDSIIFFNFRPDRARQITRAFVDKEFQGFKRKKGWFPVHFVCMTEYDAEIQGAEVAYKPYKLKNILAEVLSNHGIKQLRIAETEKYAHVTFFFNGGKEKSYPGEDRILIPSPKVATYDMKPEMSAYEVTDKVIEKIREKEYRFIVLNYANPDMVGHTGDFDATVKALEVVDECLGRVVGEVQKVNGTVLIIADHGNSEQMVNYENGEPHTAHTSNAVPFILISPENYGVKSGRLCDIAPTILDIMNIEKPEEMTGESLLIKL
ncbi:MAG: 2,3-bisphosphoglycerate-independent phosphoglycerate mutase [Thermosediminibacterales bacterium]|nr:2,3-bisphosphoglycerate-independent phosphoglycerate mutase [Thermosediminibacterales bacterium]